MIAVATGGEGIEAARQQNPDIILMDISLPDMDGLDAARLLKNDEKTRETPINAHQRPSTPINAHQRPSSPSLHMHSPATENRPSRPAATSTTPSPSGCPACSKKSKR